LKNVHVEFSELSVNLSKNIKILEGDNNLKIIRSWFCGESFIFFIITLTWNSGFIMTCLFNDLSFPPDLSLSFILKFFIYLFSGFLGIFLIYATAAAFLNKTFIEIDRNVFSIHHGPLPWYGNQKINWSDLKQVFSIEHKEVRGSNKITVPAATTYSVNVILNNNIIIKVFSNLKRPEDALVIENKIKKMFLP